MMVGFAWWTSVAGAVLIFALAAWALATDTEQSLALTADVAVATMPMSSETGSTTGSMRGEPRIRILDETSWIASARVRDVRGKLSFRPRGWGLFFALGLVAVFVAAVLGWLHQLRAILADVDRGRVFTHVNVRRLGVMGAITVAAGLAQPLLALLLRVVLDRELEIVGARPIFPEVSYWAAIVLWGLLLMILSEIWRYGVHLQRDRDLTV